MCAAQFEGRLIPLDCGWGECGIYMNVGENLRVLGEIF